MKKRVFPLVLLVGINTVCFSLAEGWLSLGFEYGNFFERTSDGGNTVQSYIGSPGINLNIYGFWNGMNVGIFVHDIFAFPQTGNSVINGVNTDINFSAYDFVMQTGIILGPGFRYNFTDKLKLQCGIGFSVLGTAGDYRESIPGYGTIGFSIVSYNLGIGCDMGIKYDITNVFYINIGSILTFDFASYTSFTSSFGNTSEWAKDYFMFGLRPYISIGINLYNDSYNVGKPKTQP